MWKQLYDIGRQLLTLSSDVQKGKETDKAHEEAIDELRQELRRVLEILQELRHTQERQQDRADLERRMLLLELENALLRFERRLPPAEKQDNEPERKE
jgi:hypothetical protein